MSKLKELELLLAYGKITRREFLARVSALGIVATLPIGLLTASAHAAAPKKGGRLRAGIAGGSTSDTLDPAPMTDAMPICINWQLRNCLVEVDHEANLVPELAESWESTPDASQWNFKLRTGVEFHNGKTLEAEDVIFSINHHRKKDSKSGAKTIVAPIKDIRADGKQTVVFTLDGGNADFPYLMSDYHLTIVPANTTNFEDGIGTGGYMLEKHEPGVRALTKRNPNYWKEGRAHFNEVEITAIADVNARTNALRSGRIDVMNRCDLKTVHLLKKVPGIQVTNIKGYKHFSLPMRTDTAPYNNSDVRLALKYAIDRERLLKTLLHGYGSLGNDHPIASTQKYYASELPQRNYDPDKAKFHFRKAGIEDHVFKLHTSDAAFDGAVDAAVLYKEHAAKAGINIQVVREPSDGYWSNVWMKVPWCIEYWSGRATADWMFSTVYAEGAAWNDTYWKHERFNKLLIMARTELDEAKRGEMYAEMQKIVRDEGGMVIPIFANWVEAATTKLKFDNPAGNWELDGLKFAERWWFGS